MNGFGGKRAHIIEDTDTAAILSQFKSRGIYAGHFNNGTFTLPKEKFAPNFLAAFKRVIDLRQDVNTPLIVAINSDKSMLDTYAGKTNEAELASKLIQQGDRAENVVSLLFDMFPERQVAAIFYDEENPEKLYHDLKRNDFGTLSLHKVGFGTNPADKPIIGAKHFDWVYACPLFNDEKPVMHSDTRDVSKADRQPDLVEKLTDEIGLHGKPYITRGGKLLFPLPSSLLQYADDEALGMHPRQLSP